MGSWHWDISTSTCIKCRHKSTLQRWVTVTSWCGHHRKFSPSEFYMILSSSTMLTAKWWISSRLECSLSCWGNGIQHHALLPYTPQPQNSHLKWDATVVNLQAQMSSFAHLEIVGESTFTRPALSWPGCLRHGNVWSAENKFSMSLCMSPSLWQGSWLT